MNNYSYNQCFIRWKTIEQKDYSKKVDTLDFISTYSKIRDSINNDSISLDFRIVLFLNNIKNDYKKRIRLFWSSTNYLFVTDIDKIKVSDKEKINGFANIYEGSAMDRVAIIFKHNTINEYNTTIVHEIGHLQGLYHTFKDKDNSHLKIFIEPKSSSQNFMDYCVNPNSFWFFQWIIINNNLK